MAVLRFISGLCLLVAVIALIADASALHAGSGSILGTSFQKHWSDIAPGSLAAAKAVVSGATQPFVWDWIVAPVIGLQTWLLFGLLALAAGYGGRRREKINIFVN